MSTAKLSGLYYWNESDTVSSGETQRAYCSWEILKAIGDNTDYGSQQTGWSRLLKCAILSERKVSAVKFFCREYLHGVGKCVAGAQNDTTYLKRQLLPSLLGLGSEQQDQTLVNVLETYDPRVANPKSRFQDNHVRLAARAILEIIPEKFRCSEAWKLLFWYPVAGVPYCNKGCALCDRNIVDQENPTPCNVHETFQRGHNGPTHRLRQFKSPALLRLLSNMTSNQPENTEKTDGLLDSARFYLPIYELLVLMADKNGDVQVRTEDDMVLKAFEQAQKFLRESGESLADAKPEMLLNISLGTTETDVPEPKNMLLQLCSNLSFINPGLRGHIDGILKATSIKKKCRALMVQLVELERYRQEVKYVVDMLTPILGNADNARDRFSEHQAKARGVLLSGPTDADRGAIKADAVAGAVVILGLRPKDVLEHVVAVDTANGCSQIEGLKCVEYVFPKNCIFDISDDPPIDDTGETVHNWWDDLVDSENTRFCCQRVALRDVTDDHAQSVSGTELLMGSQGRFLLYEDSDGTPMKYDVNASVLEELTRPNHRSSDVLCSTLYSLAHPYTTSSTQAGSSPVEFAVLGLKIAVKDTAADLMTLLKVVRSSDYDNTVEYQLSNKVDSSVLLSIVVATARLRQTGQRRGNRAVQLELLTEHARNPILTDFLPLALRAKELQLTLDNAYWRQRLRLSDPTDENGRLMLAIVGSSDTASQRIITLPQGMFHAVVGSLSSGNDGLSLDLERPVILKFTLARNNLASTRQKLTEVLETMCFTIVFLQLGEKLPAGKLASLLQSFIVVVDANVRIVLEHDEEVVSNLLLTDIGKYLWNPTVAHDSGTSGNGNQPATELDTNCSVGKLVSMGGALADESDGEAPGGTPDMASLAHDAFAELQRSNRTVYDWLWITQRLGTNRDTPTVLYVTTSSPSTVALLVRVIRAKLDKVFSAPLLLDCADSKFYVKFDHALKSPTRVQQGNAGDDVPRGCVLLRSGDLLSFEEKKSIAESLAKANMKCVLFVSGTSHDDHEVNTSCTKRTAARLSVVNFSVQRPTALLPMLLLEPGDEHATYLKRCMALQLLCGSAFGVNSISSDPNHPWFVLDFSNFESLPQARVEALRELMYKILGDRQGDPVPNDAGEDYITAFVKTFVAAVECQDFNAIQFYPPFDQFVLWAPLTQVLPPRDLLAYWLNLVCKTPIRCPPVENTYGSTLLELLLRPQQEARIVGYKARFNVSAHGSGEILKFFFTAASRGEQLPWNELDAPFASQPPNVVDLVNMLSSAPNPLWIAVCIPPKILHSTLQSVQSTDAQRLADALCTNSHHMQLVHAMLSRNSKRLGQGCPLMLSLAVLHFNIVSKAMRPDTAMALGPESYEHFSASRLHESALQLHPQAVQAIVHKGLYLHLASSQVAADSLLRALLELDSPLKLFVDQPDLHAWLKAPNSLKSFERVLNAATVWGAALLFAIREGGFEATDLCKTALSESLDRLYIGATPEFFKPWKADNRRAQCTPKFVGTLLEQIPLLSMKALYNGLVLPSDSRALVRYLHECIQVDGSCRTPYSNIMEFVRVAFEQDTYVQHAWKEMRGLCRIVWAAAVGCGPEVIKEWSALGSGAENFPGELPITGASEHMGTLRRAVLNHWHLGGELSTPATIPFAKDVNRLSPASRAALLRTATDMMQHDDIPQREAFEKIIIVLWSYCPQLDLPLWPESEPAYGCMSDAAIQFLFGLEHTAFVIRVSAMDHVSTLATWVATPNHLPAAHATGMQTRFQPRLKNMPGARSNVCTPKTVVFAQKTKDTQGRERSFTLDVVKRKVW